MDKKKHVVYLGCPGFPYGLAEMQKIILISKSLIFRGNSVTVVSRYGIQNKNEYPGLQIRGEFDKIRYVYTSGYQFRENSFFKRNFFKVKGRFNEFLFLKRASKNQQLEFAILSTHKFFDVAYYCLLSKLLGFKTVLNYVEYQSGIEKGSFQIDKKLNDFLFDNYAIKMADLIFPISEFLIAQIESVSSGKKYLKIPGLTDSERYANITKVLNEKYFLFCGAAAYKDVIYFIVDAFSKVNDNSIDLYLVVNGSEADKSDVKNYIKTKDKKDRIKMFSNLSQEGLFTYYKNAIALLIPLRPTAQDIARFPHKTGEYLASGNPVISTNYGEIKYYFTDMKNMLLAESYDIDLFVNKMQFVIDNPEIAKKIGTEGKDAGIKLFDYRYKAKEIDYFLDSALEDKVG